MGVCRNAYGLCKLSGKQGGASWELMTEGSDGGTKTEKVCKSRHVVFDVGDAGDAD